jgi:hypothetical protein
MRMIDMAASFYSVASEIAFFWNRARKDPELCGPTGTEAALYKVFDRKFDRNVWQY